MTKKLKDWERLHTFTSWEQYEAMTEAELAELCGSMEQQIQQIQAQMDQKEIIYHRTRRFRAVANATHLVSRLREIYCKKLLVVLKAAMPRLEQAPEAPTHTHKL